MIEFNTDGIQVLVARIRSQKSLLRSSVRGAVRHVAKDMQNQLKDQAPKSNVDNLPIASDEPGPLSQSFKIETKTTGDVFELTLKTTQPTKLQYLRQGTGLYGEFQTPIIPLEAHALYWQGAEHPVASVQGQQANDFVTPILEAGKIQMQDAVHESMSLRAALSSAFFDDADPGDGEE